MERDRRGVLLADGDVGHNALLPVVVRPPNADDIASGARLEAPRRHRALSPDRRATACRSGPGRAAPRKQEERISWALLRLPSAPEMSRSSGENPVFQAL